ncbi:hypothetical protein [Jiella marina]|uniref:hypothetical protein n=1 Tax=Jiella sp. LLJ827 TaxID=2917712 RepID=UPI002101B609|nr:hypothetical protein [Jiella sp. LLJ827]MCQ0989212.1 hypothetical protein [Jiella sp. LLJ827]
MSARFDKAAGPRENPYQAIHGYFDRAIMKAEIERGFTGEDWREYQTIVAEHDRRKQAAEEVYRSEYEVRVASVRGHLIDQAGNDQPALNHPWFRFDSFGKERLDRQAQRMVQADHARTLQAITRDQDEALAPIYARAEARLPPEDREQEPLKFETPVTRATKQNRRIGPLQT